jgi:hypothetical protein
VVEPSVVRAFGFDTYAAGKNGTKGKFLKVRSVQAGSAIAIGAMLT